MKIYSGPLSMFGAKVQIAALEKGIAHDVVMVPFETRYEPKHPDVLRINPKAQVPVLVDGDLEIFDSTQIFEYLEDIAPSPNLWPREPRARARARLLELQSDEVFFPHIIKLMGLQEVLERSEARAAIAAARAYYAKMDALLEGKQFLAENYSYADIAFVMAQFFAARLGAPMDDTTVNLRAWRARMLERPPVSSVLTPMMNFLRARNRPVPIQ